MAIFATVQEDIIAEVLDGILLEVRNEVMRATIKHGSESMSMPGHDVGKRLGILMEEVGEVARATTYDNGNEANKREELIQTAAMAAAWVVADEVEKLNTKA